MRGLAAALDAAGELQLHGRRLRLSSLDKVLWPATGFTKLELLDYYAGIAPVLLPHLAGRPLTLGRFPDGVDGPGFAQTECRGRPDWLPTAALRLRDGTVRRYCLAEDLPGLLWLANLGTVELHPFLFRGGPEAGPDALVLDVDPGPATSFVDCCRCALGLRRALADDGLECFPKSSGSSGLHVYVPLNRPHDWAHAKAFARAVAERLAGQSPGAVTASARRAGRRGKVFVDWLQNDSRRSTVAPYSLRATDRPAVSAPLAWEEVERAAADGGERLRTLGPTEALGRVERRGDLFRAVLELEQSLPRDGIQGSSHPSAGSGASG